MSVANIYGKTVDSKRLDFLVDDAGRMQVGVFSTALPTGASTEAKQDTGNTSLGQIKSGIDTLNSLIPTIYDYISLSYTGSNLTGVVFKQGGGTGTIVSTLTLAYDGSNNLSSVTKT